MGLFDRMKEPVFLKSSSTADMQLEQLHALLADAPSDMKETVEQQIRLVEAGIAGEKNIDFELRNSHYPMFILHDLYIKKGDLTAQIDYLIVTRGITFFIECKNLYGNIEIDHSGNFIRTFSYGKYVKKEGLYSPVTQNQRHLDLMRQIRAEDKSAIIRSAWEKNFPKWNKSIVVLANPRTVLNDRFAPKEIRQQVIRADQLVAYIKRSNEAISREDLSSDKDMEKRANLYLSLHTENETDYTAVLKEQIKASLQQSEKDIAIADANTSSSAVPVCPLCGAAMVLRTARAGINADKQFYGCSNYPKCHGIVNILYEK